MADVRFEILVNGAFVCTAGVTGHGAITAIIDRVRRTMKYFDEAKSEYPDETPEEFTRERINISVNAADWERERNAHWLRRDLVPGDEVTIRILGPGDVSPPESVIPLGADWR